MGLWNKGSGLEDEGEEGVFFLLPMFTDLRRI